MSTPRCPRRVLATTLLALVWAPLLVAPLACAGRSARSGPTPAKTAGRNAPDTSSVAIGDGKSIERLFTGRFPGVDVVSASDGGLRITIRGGGNSFVSGNEPLYILDGTPLPQGTGGIVFVNPYDIQKIEVLKNPADIAIYGLRGGNGVIRITTIRPVRR